MHIDSNMTYSMKNILKVHELREGRKETALYFKKSCSSKDFC